MQLKKYFNMLESSTFGPQLSKFKSTFSEEDLNAEYQTVLIKFLDTSRISIQQSINKILNNSLSIFKNFILSDSKESQYANCRTLKKVLNVNKLTSKFVKDDQYKTIQSSTKDLINHIDQKGHLYFAIAKELDGSNLEALPPEIIGQIFHYVDEVNL